MALMKFNGRHGDLIKIMKSPFLQCYMTFLDMTIYSDTLHWSDISKNFDLVTEVAIITDLTSVGTSILPFTLLPNFRRFP